MKGKDNVVADALSRKCLLVTKLELNVIGFEHVKDLYTNDPSFAIPYAKCIAHTCWDKYYLKDGYLMRANKLCIPESSLRLLLLQEAHGSDLWAILDATRRLPHSPTSTFGKRCSV